MNHALDLILTRKEREKEAIFESDYARVRSDGNGLLRSIKEVEFEQRFQRVKSINFKAPRCVRLNEEGSEDHEKDSMHEDSRESHHEVAEGVDGGDAGSTQDSTTSSPTDLRSAKRVSVIP